MTAEMRKHMIDMAATITAGLLASGHYTNEGDSRPFAIYSTKENQTFAVLDAIGIVDEIVAVYESAYPDDELEPTAP